MEDVEQLADLVTSALDGLGPVGALAAPVVEALKDVWEGYFGAPIPPGRTNWNAYTHQQMYDMLWQNADPGDVGAVADEWGRHSTALLDHGQALRDQRGALGSNWSGPAAELATERFGELSDRHTDIGTRAGAIRQAAQHAGDALSVARNTMPKPPGDPTAPTVAAATAGASAGAAIGSVVGAAAGGVGAGPGALMGAAIGALAAGGGSLFLASVAAAEEKAKAVHVMQQYESSLRQSSQAISAGDSAAVPSSGSMASTSLAGYTGGGIGGGTGVPWRHLTGSGPLPAGLVASLRAEGEAAALARAGAALAAARNAGGAGTPGGGARRQGKEDEEHKNRMPRFDHQLFAVDEYVTAPVIGLEAQP